ncbi:MAG TPA: NAD(P)/FAD-dependent oxidoreductase [Pseudobdellovibrionaceae bacterium]|nr:NAD(P)/FAD-dependent oxidoreductase [Pseudobdellovibrionaceae bacterium]
MENKLDTTVNKIDAIIIGSGVGGLAAASLLTKIFNKKVLVIERHGKLGGFTHTFKRLDKFKWDVGLHYVGDLEKGSPSENLFSFITANQLTWNKMPPIFEKFIYPDFEFQVPSHPKEYQEQLTQKFPNETYAIHKYFKDIKALTQIYGLKMASKHFPPFVEKTLKLYYTYRLKKTLGPTLSGRLYSLTTKEYLDYLTKNELLKSVLCSQWMDYGVPPAQSSIFTHATIASHYLNGAYYPQGGSDQIASLIKKDLEAKGCQFLTSHEVKEILIENHQAVGVHAHNRKSERPEDADKIFKSDIVISNAGARNTYLKLLPAFVKIPFRQKLQDIQPGCTNLTLFIGFKENPSSLNLKGENFWIFSNPNHDDIEKNKNRILGAAPEMCYISFPSLKDPLSTNHTAEILVPVGYEPFFKWKDQPAKNRDAEYKRLKEFMSQEILNFVEKHIPGFKDIVEFADLGTPLTNEHYENSFHGEIYGIPATPERINAPWISPQTPVKNLFLVGADATVHGIVGALWSSISCLLSIYGWKSFGKISEAIASRKK